MATRNNRGVTLWLYLFLMLLCGGILLSLNSGLDPVERALGIAHGECSQTRHATLYCFDHIFATDFHLLQAGLPEGALVEQRGGAGLPRLLLLSVMALFFSYSLGQLIRRSATELAHSRKRLNLRSLGWLFPASFGVFLAHQGLSTAPVFLLYVLLVLRLATLSARQTVPGGKLCKLAKRLNWLGTAWIAQLSTQLLGAGAQEQATAIEPSLLILGLAVFPLRSCLASRIQGGPTEAREAMRLWSNRRYWLLTVVLSLTLCSAAILDRPTQESLTLFALPMALFFLCNGLFSSLASRPTGWNPRLSSVGRILACNWLVFGAVSLVAEPSLCATSFSWFTVGWLAIGCCLLLMGRPWGSKVKSRKSAFDSHQTKESQKTGLRFEQNQIPAMSAVVLTISMVGAGLAHRLPSWCSTFADSPISDWPNLLFQAQIREVQTSQGTLAFVRESQGKFSDGQTMVIEVAHTWPETVGSILLFCGGLVLLGLSLQWVNHRLDSDTRDALSGEVSLLFGSLFGAYALAGVLGWHWYPSLPFVGFYVLSLAAPSLLKLLPIRDRRPAILRQMGASHETPECPLDFTFMNALGLRVVVGNRVWRYLSEENSGLRTRLLPFVDQHSPHTNSRPGPEQLALFLDEVCLRTMDVRDKSELVDFANYLEFTIREKGRHRLTGANVQAWLDVQSRCFPGRVGQVRKRLPLEQVQSVLIRLVDAGSLLEKPAVIVDVLATQSGDDIALAEKCLKRLKQGR